jgi:hypothetical protein
MSHKKSKTYKKSFNKNLGKFDAGKHVVGESVTAASNKISRGAETIHSEKTDRFKKSTFKDSFKDSFMNEATQNNKTPVSPYMKISDIIDKNLDGIEGLLVDAFIDGLGVIVDISIPGKMRSGASSTAKSAAASAAILALAEASATSAFDTVMDDFLKLKDEGERDGNIKIMKEAGPFPKSRLEQVETNEAEAKVDAIKAVSKFLNDPKFTLRTGSGGGGGKKTQKRKFKKKKTRRYKGRCRGRRQTRKR